MSRASLRHVPMTLDKVQITLTAEDGRALTATLDGAYLRAKCWGVLADIDPAGLMEAAIGQRRAGVHLVGAGLSNSSRVLLALRDGPLTNQGLRLALGDGSTKPANISHAAHELIRQGLAYRADRNPAGPGAKATYALTEAGKARAEQIDPLAKLRAAA